MTGSENEVKAGSLGNIKDFLKRANGTDDSNSWRERLRGRVGGESPPTQNQTTNHPTEKDKSVIVERASEQSAGTKPTTQTHEAAAPAPAKERSDAERKVAKPKQTIVKPSPKYRSGYKEFRRQINDFKVKDNEGKRHWVYLPDSILAALNISYGERCLSAVLSVLAENHIRDNKEDMIKSIADKSSLFSD